MLERRLTESNQIKERDASPKVALLLWTSVGLGLLSRLWIDNILYRIMCFPEIARDSLLSIIVSQFEIDGGHNFFLSGALSTALSFFIFYRRWNGEKMTELLDRLVWATVSRRQLRSVYRYLRPYIESGLNIATWVAAFSSHLWHVQNIMGTAPSLTGWLQQKDGLLASLYSPNFVQQAGKKVATSVLALDSCAYVSFYPSIPFRAFQEVEEINSEAAEASPDRPDPSEASDTSFPAGMDHFRFSAISTFLPNPFYTSRDNTSPDELEMIESTVKGSRPAAYRSLTVASALIRLSGIPLQYYLIRTLISGTAKFGSISSSPLFLRYGSPNAPSGFSCGTVNKVLLCQGLGLACQLLVGATVFGVGEYISSLFSI